MSTINFQLNTAYDQRERHSVFSDFCDEVNQSVRLIRKSQSVLIDSFSDMNLTSLDVRRLKTVVSGTCPMGLR